MIPIPAISEMPKLFGLAGRAGQTRHGRGTGGAHPGRVLRRAGAAALTALSLAAAGCGSSGSPSSGSSSPAAGHAGGTYTILASSAFGVADPAQNYTLEEWQLTSGAESSSPTAR